MSLEDRIQAITDTLHALADTPPQDTILEITIRPGHTNPELDTAYMNITLYDDTEAQAITTAAGNFTRTRVELSRYSGGWSYQWTRPGVAILGEAHYGNIKEG